MTIKLKVMKRHWSKFDDIGIQVAHDSGYWFVLRITMPDDEIRFLRRPFKTFNEVVAAIIEYLSELRTKNFQVEKAEIEARQKDLIQEEKVSKDLSDQLPLLGAYFSIGGSPVGLGLGIASIIKDDSHDRIPEGLDPKKTQVTSDFIYAPKGGYDLVRIPGGEFLMGTPDAEKERCDDEEPPHIVRVPDFYMGRYPVTNKEYSQYLRENKDAARPMYWRDPQFNRPRQPVVGVSWEEARQYARWAGLGLPSEAQWKYACRAGSRTQYHSGDAREDLCKVGWYAGNSDGKPHPVGEKDPNAFGLYDMHGNVWEWVEDDHHMSYYGAPKGGSAWRDTPRGAYRVIRGGCWSFSDAHCRSAYRYRFEPGERFNLLGFRLVLIPDQPG
jgi:formylglycine-generating enzyme required for sulfatase activity